MRTENRSLRRKQARQKLQCELEKRSYSVTVEDDYSIRVNDCLILVVVHNRESASEFQQENLFYITFASIANGLQGVLSYVETKLTEVEQMSKKQIPTTWKGMRYSQDDRPKPVKHTYVDPDSLPPTPDKSVPRYKQMKKYY
jgi:hypothetical protein